MTRKKVKLAFITNDSARKTTYKKRKKGMLKKVSELTTLCGIEACVIIYSPYDSQPEVWPSPARVESILAKFRQMSELEQCKKMMNQESFMKQRVLKANDQVQKLKKENREKEIAQIMFQYLGAGKVLHNLSMVDLNDLAWLIEQNLRDISRRMQALKKEETQNQIQIQSLEGRSKVRGEDEVMQKQQLFMDLMNSGGDGTLPFGDVNHQNAFGPNPFFP